MARQAGRVRHQDRLAPASGQASSSLPACEPIISAPDAFCVASCSSEPRLNFKPLQAGRPPGGSRSRPVGSKCTTGSWVSRHAGFFLFGSGLCREMGVTREGMPLNPKTGVLGRQRYAAFQAGRYDGSKLHAR